MIENERQIKKEGGQKTNLAVLQHPLEVGDEKALVLVVVGLQPLAHGLQVHRELDVLIVVRNHLRQKTGHRQVYRIRLRTGSVCFRPPGSGSFYHQAKIVRKTLIPTVL
jgi:hypothetical protein